jgi:autotransporter-associated beta strand protein
MLPTLLHFRVLVLRVLTVPRFWPLQMFFAIAVLSIGTVHAQTTGLTGQYYDNADFTALTTTRVDATVNFDWGTSAPSGSAFTDGDTFSVVWSGQLEPEFSELYTIYVTADDGARIWIDDRMVAARTFAQGTGEMRGQVRLTAGQRVNVRLEYIEQSGSASVKLEWSSASRVREIIPQSRLFPARVDKAGGSILKEHWSNISGTAISSLTSNANYPNKPSGRELLTSFECMVPNWTDNYGAPVDNYGTRVTGYVVPPASGNYTFAVSADDTAELYLSTDSNPANKTLIASVTSATAYRQWNAQPSQQSAPRTLVQGTRYYVELLHKEGTGSDHFSVGWMKPGDTAFSVIPGSALVQAGIDRTQPTQSAILDTLAQAHPRLLATSERFAWLRGKWQSPASSQPKTWAQGAIDSADAILPEPPVAYTKDDDGKILAISQLVKDRIQKLGLAWWLTGDNQYAERAWTELNTVADNTIFPDWNPAHFLDTAEMTYSVGLGYDWFYNYWTQTRRDTIRTALVNKGLLAGISQYTSNKSWTQPTNNNWNPVCNGGLAIGALAVGTESEATVEDVLNRAFNSLRPVMAHYTADDGAWYEGPGYWAYAFEYNSRMMAGLESALGCDFGLSTTRNLSESGFFAMAATGPFGQPYGFADVGAPVSVNEDGLHWLARRYNQPLPGWWENTHGGGVIDALWWNDYPVSPAAAALPPDFAFRGETGTAFNPQEVVTLRTKWSDSRATYVGMKAGQVGASHGDLDQGSFLLDALGKRWFHELGRDNYGLPGYFTVNTVAGAGNDRWDYYRTRAEGQNTIILDPGFGPELALNAVAPLIAFQSEPCGSRSIAIYDLTPAHSNVSGVTRVWRGIQLMGKRDQVLVQDEIVSTSGKTLWWFAHYSNPATAVSIDPTGTEATLTQGAERLWCKIVSGDGTFQIRDATPLPSSPNPQTDPQQNPNTGYKKLAINLSGVTNTTLAVWMVPLETGENPPTTLPAITPLSSWNPAATNDEPNTAGGDATGTADNSVDVDLRAYASDDNTPSEQLRFSVGTATNGTVTLLADGHTARFTPNAGYIGVPSFSFTATDTTPDARLLLAYDFDLPDANSTTVTTDVTGNSRDGTLDKIGTGNYALASTQPAALHRDGRSLDLVENGGANAARLSRVVTTSELNFNTANWTISGWFNRRDSNNEDTIFHLHVGDGFGSGEELYLWCRSASELRLQHYPGPDVDISTTGVLPGGWHHFAVVRNGTTISLYLDGSLVGSDSAFALNINQTYPLIFGGHTETNATYAPRWFDGQLDELAVFAAALNPSEISTLAGGMTVRHFGGLSSTGTITLSATPVTSVWTATTTGSTLTWSTGTNWSSGTAPASNNRGNSLEFFTGQTLGAGTVTASNNIAAGFQLNVLTLAGTASAAANAAITGGSLTFMNNGALNPVVNLNATAGSGFSYDVSTPLTLAVPTTFQGNGSAAFRFNGAISGAGGLTKSGSSTLILTADNTYAGGTTISAGTLQIGDNTTTGTLPVGTVINDGTLRIHHSDTAFNFSNAISGTGGLQIGVSSGGTPSAITTVSSANSFTGNVTVSSGGLRIARPDALGIGTKTITLTGLSSSGDPHLRLDGSTGDIDLPATFSFVTSNSNPGNGTILNEAGNNTIHGNFTLGSGGGDTRIRVAAGTLTLTGNFAPNITSRNLVLDGAGSGTITGSIADGAGSLVLTSIQKSDLGTWTLSGSVTHTGTIAANAGTLIVSGSVSGPGIIVNAGTLVVDGTISGPGSVTVAASTGTLVVNNTGTINIPSGGSVAVNAGTLITNGIINGPGLLTVASGAVLTGSSPIAANTTINGTHQPGTGISTQVFTGTLTYGSTGRLAWEFDTTGTGTSFDQVNAASVTAINGAAIDLVFNSPNSSANFAEPYWAQSHSWTVLTANSITGAFTVGTVSADAAGHAFSSTSGNFSIQQTATTVNLLWTPAAPQTSNWIATGPDGSPLDIDLWGLIIGGATPKDQLRFSVSSAVNGSVTLLADGHTARFTPTPGYTGVPNFTYTAVDTQADARMLLAYDFDLPDSNTPTALPDVTGNFRDGTIDYAGNGVFQLVNDKPAALGGQGLRSIDLTEDGTNAARIQRTITAAELDWNTHDWTVTGWFKRRDTTNDDFVWHVGYGDGFGSNNELYLNCPSGATTVRLQHYAGTGYDVDITKSGITAGTWHHFAVVRSGTTLLFYVDGALAGSDTAFSLALDQSAPLVFGGHAIPTFQPGRWFDGQLDDCGLFTAALSATEVQTLAGGMPVRNFGGRSSSGTVSIEATATTSTWNATGTGSALNWSNGANWSGGTAPASSRGNTLVFFNGQTLGAGTITSSNDFAGGFTLRALTLAGTTSGAATAAITGNTVTFTNNGAANPIVNLDALAGAGFTYDVSAPLTLAVTTTFQGSGTATFRFSGNIDGAGGLTKTGSSTLVLSGTNSYAGPTTISTGTLQIGNDGATGTLGAGDIVDNATLRFDRTGTLLVPNNISGTGGLIIDCPVSAGTVVLSGTNSFTGTVNVSSGALRITNSNALGTGTKSVLLAAGTLGNPNLRLDGSAGAITLAAGISFSTSNSNAANGAIFNEAGNNTINGNVSLTSGGGDTRLVSAAGTLTMNGNFAPITTSRSLVLAGAGSGVITGAIQNGTGSNTLVRLDKAETGTWTLSGAVTHTGTVNVNGGTLIVNGSVNGPNTFTVATSAKLSGSGTIATNTTLNGTHQPGAGLGTQTFNGTLSYGSASHLSWELGSNTNAGAGTNFDRVAAAGVTITSGAAIDLVFNRPGSTVNFTNTFWSQNRTWTIVTASSLTGSFALGTISVDSAGNSAVAFGTFSLQHTATAVNLVWTASSGFQSAGSGPGISTSFLAPSQSITSLPADAGVSPEPGSSGPVVAGNYSGLLSTSVTPVEYLGFARFAVTSRGQFTGRIWFDSVPLPIRGQFNAEGIYSGLIRSNHPEPLVVTLQYRAGETATISGTLSDGVVTAAISTRQSTFNTKTNPCPQAGSYRVTLLPADGSDASTPQQQATGRVSVRHNGSLFFSSRLSDGTPISQGTWLTGGGIWPLYRSLYAHHGHIAGPQDFEELEASSISGVVDWAAPFQSMRLRLTGDDFQPPKPARSR